MELHGDDLTRAAREALASTGAVRIHGAEGSGRSATLRLGAGFAEQAIYVKAPLRRVHHAVLEQLAGGLTERGEAGARIVDDPGASWQAKVDAVGTTLRRLNGAVVLLLDDLDRVAAENDPLDVADSEGPPACERLLAMLAEVAETGRVVWTSVTRANLGPLSGRTVEVGGGPIGPPAAGVAPNTWSLVSIACGHRWWWLRLATALLECQSPDRVISLALAASDLRRPDPLVEAVLTQLAREGEIASTRPVLAAMPDDLEAGVLERVGGLAKEHVERLVVLGLLRETPVGMECPAAVRRAVPEAPPELALRFARWCERQYRQLDFSECGLRARFAASERYAIVGDVEGVSRVCGGFASALADLGRKLGAEGREQEKARRFDQARSLFFRAASAYDAALRLEPRRPYALHYRGWNRHRAGLVGASEQGVAEIEADLEAAVAQASSHAWYWQRLALFHVHLRRFDAARSVLERAAKAVAPGLQRDELFAPVLRSLRRAGRLALARQIAVQAAAATPESATATTFDGELTRLLVATGSRLAACRYLSARLRRFGAEAPEPLKRALADWYEEEGFVVEAARWRGERERVVVPLRTEAAAARDYDAARGADTAAYAGQWLLIRNGVIVRASSDAVELTKGVEAHERPFYLTVYIPPCEEVE